MRRLLPALIALAVAALGLTGCGSDSTVQHASSPGGAGAVRTAAAASSRQPKLRHHAPRASVRSSSGLPYSTANNEVIQPQRPAGTCHALGSGSYERPDPSCTPGALNPAVTQGTIGRTICVSGWTDRVRPPESVSEPEKLASIAAYDGTAATDAYEYDHFVPLELGGATNDPRNLWPEPGASPNPKDAIEEELRQQVCDRRISLARAQREIVSNWASLAEPAAREHSVTAPACNVSASYSATYRDFDVYVHSNQPDQPVSVTDTSGDSKSWHTDGSGYADVYLHAASSASGEGVTVHVGAATCHGRL